ncbi:MAG: hypothetical protein IJ087_00705 [Eggerthellaceae bacterium]|nr:hypothetical protein [Eggerthellaceae bacterium]
MKRTLSMAALDARRGIINAMPSWNIHTAHVERLFAEHSANELGIADANAFLFGNYAPDIYLGFMVPDTTFRLDYCLTHLATPHNIPAPDADRFWDECIAHEARKPKSGNVMSLTLGAWAHLVADRTYNLRFRQFCDTRDTPQGEQLRLRKQADFDLFGHSLGIASCAEANDELYDAARRFRPYSILPADVERTIEVAAAIVRESAARVDAGEYQLLSPEWLAETFELCHTLIAGRLLAWREHRV